MYVCMYCVVSVQVIQLGVDEGVEMIKLNLKRPCGLNGYFSFVSSLSSSSSSSFLKLNSEGGFNVLLFVQIQ